MYIAVSIDIYLKLYSSRRKSSAVDLVTATIGLGVVGKGGGGPRRVL